MANFQRTYTSSVDDFRGVVNLLPRLIQYFVLDSRDYFSGTGPQSSNKTFSIVTAKKTYFLREVPIRLKALYLNFR